MAREPVVKRLTNGVLNTSIDIVLFYFALLGASVGKSRSPRGVNQMFAEAWAFLEEVNHSTIPAILHLSLG